MMEGALPNEVTSTSHQAEETDDDGVVETDPDGRFMRYKEIVGRGRFKEVFKSFDSSMGIDVAWCKIGAGNRPLSDEQLDAVEVEIQNGLDLEHPNIIKCLKCWKDGGTHCINLITELFTSGNLRQYRTIHKHLDMRAVKRMAVQILKGLQYLHNMEPPVTHGDLRCDKIYVNGHSGEIKIGDLGLATLMPYRWDEEGPRKQVLEMTESADVFAFGLCLLELLTLKQLDPQHCQDWESHLNELEDEESRVFLSKCLNQDRPSAAELIEDSYFKSKKPVAAQARDSLGRQGGRNSSEEGASSEGAERTYSRTISTGSRTLHEAVAHEKRMTADGDSSTVPMAVGKLRGEDYNFEFAGNLKDGKMIFRLVMTQAVEDASNGCTPFMRTIDFFFYPETDTADNLAAEISVEFNLSPTDTEICAAALRELLAKEMPDSVK